MKDNKRGRPAIKPSIKQLIFTRAFKDKDTPRLALAIELTKLIKEMGEIPPSEETTIKLISQARNSRFPFDETWTLGSLSDKDKYITPEAMPAVIVAFKRRLAEGKMLTGREALWVARLHKIVSPDDLLLDWATFYAWEEWLSLATKMPFDSAKLDKTLISDIHHASQHVREIFRDVDIYEIAKKYNADANKLMELNLSLEKTEEAAKSGKYETEVRYREGPYRKKG